ncbi:MAG: NADH dehydrogenase FAD-containing subunit [Planctomycetes bacterium]|nr:NADH dehydrogenase FAD-containing subunit [Planctomycetota bacterium]
MLWLLLLLPFAAGVLALLLPGHAGRRTVLLGAAATHFALVLVALAGAAPPAWGGRLALDGLGGLFLLLSSGLFAVASAYAVGYLRRERVLERLQGTARPDFLEGGLFANVPEAVFTATLLCFLGTMTGVCLAHDFQLLWVLVEGTTLASAPLIYFHRHHRSLEASWKYLLLCSVGISIALLGTLFLAVAGTDAQGGSTPLLMTALAAKADTLAVPWVKAAFVLILVGYGAKMGLAPMHNWLPDAHSEAPSLVSALLSGALLNCAFLGVLRGLQVCGMVGEAAFARELLLGFGLVSLAIAALFVLRQADFKRLLAYSSVEHMGLLAVGVGLAGAGGEAAMLHAVNHTVAKGMLFLLAGNLLAAFHTKEIHQVRGALRVLPVSGGLWLLGLFAITGTPPFGMFHSELALVRAALEQGRPVVAAGVLLGLGAVFAGMSAVFLRMCLGAPRGAVAAPAREEFSAILPPALLATLALWLGLQVPGELAALLRAAAAQLGALP